MNSNENDWIQMAFGELDEAQRASLEETIANDERARSSVAEYAALREGLKALKQVPEMQLGRERLRHALLEGGLKQPKAAFPWWALSWLPAGAAAVWVASVLMRSPIPVAPVLIAPNPEGSTAVALRLPEFDEPILTRKMFFPVDRVSAPTDFGTVEAVVSDQSAARSSNAEPRHRPSRRSGQSPSRPIAASKVIRAEDIVAMPSALGADSSAMLAAPVVEGDTDGGADDSLVMIQAEDDVRTGTPIATEVRADANLIVGG